VTLHG